MRARIDRKESSRSMFKASRVLEQSSSASPEGGGTDDHQDPRVTGPQQRKTTDASPKGQGEASGHPQKRAGSRCGYLQARSTQQWEEATQLERPRMTQRKNERKPPAGEKSEHGTGAVPRSFLASTSSPTAGRATMTSTRAGGLLHTRPSAGRTGHGSDTGRRSSHQRRSRRCNTQGGCLSIRSRRAQLNPYPGCRTSCTTHNRSLGRGPPSGLRKT